MADISAKDVMALRNETGLPMMACKKALAEAGGDKEKAIDLLRMQMKGKMEKRADRAAGEGRIAIALADDQSAAAIAELRSETDFTAKNQEFADAVSKIAALALEEGEGDIEPTDEMKAAAETINIKTGENISVGRVRKIAAGSGNKFGTYIHHDGKTGVLLTASQGVPDETLRQICMHVTAAVPRPAGVTPDDLPADVVEKERAFRVAQAMESGKPQEIAEKMVEGGMKKFFAEIALLEQPFVMDPSKQVKDLLDGGTITGFVRWQVGETAEG